MTTDQVLVQIRMDAKLKEEAAEVFDKMGIDIPTAVRMFLKLLSESSVFLLIRMYPMYRLHPNLKR